MAGPFSLADERADDSVGDAGDKPLHILQIAEAESIGPGEDNARALAKAVIAAGGRASIAGSGPATARLAVSDAAQVSVEAGGRRRARREAAAALAAALGEVDVIHAHDAVSAEIGAAAAAALGAHLVTSLHHPLSYGFFGGGPVKELLQAERIIAASGVIAETASKGLKGDTSRVVVIPKGVDMDVFAEEVVPPTRTIRTAEDWGLAEDTRRLILVPEPIGPDSGAEVIVEAMAQLGDVEAVCLMVADASAPAIEETILDRGLAGRVRLAQPAMDLPAALKLSAVVALSNAKPPATGAYLIEAQAMGRPVIAPDHGAAVEAVEHGSTGWLTPPGDPSALAGAIREALSLDSSQLAHMGLAGRARVRSRFTLAATLNATLGVYEELRGRSVAPRR